ncbi:hypothetical protein [Flavobacterium sp. WG21]|uniref:hypothetical protein n=1 Tax=Flavobacterium sp. WG21 TaxID=1229487 RepID=UPI00034937B7|nr:hypothetical protein [Flavobacterium sp. WG21]
MKLDIRHNEIINTIKILIYKEDPLLLEKIDFDDDNVFLEPLLFAYFNLPKTKHNNLVLEEIMQGYFISSKEVFLNYSYNDDGIAYLPKIGYYIKNKNGLFDSIDLIENTNIEILKYKVKFLGHIYKDFDNKQVESNKIEIENAYKKNILFLHKAFKLIKENVFEQFELIESNCKKCVIFKSNPKNTNSFAAISAHGVAFFNAYQDDYDEVFFVDDIAHQTGHIILSALFYNRKDFFKIDEEQNIGKILLNKDSRTIYVLIHAFYTYYTTFLCLDACLEANSFNAKQKNEAIGRIGFYLNKCKKDIQNFDKIIDYFGSIENILTLSGIKIYEGIKEKYFEVLYKWEPITSEFKYINQPYNFTYSKFTELN